MANAILWFVDKLHHFLQAHFHLLASGNKFRPWQCDPIYEVLSLLLINLASVWVRKTVYISFHMLFASLSPEEENVLYERKRSNDSLALSLAKSKRNQNSIIQYLLCSVSDLVCSDKTTSQEASVRVMRWWIAVLISYKEMLSWHDKGETTAWSACLFYNKSMYTFPENQGVLLSVLLNFPPLFKRSCHHPARTTQNLNLVATLDEKCTVSLKWG